MIPILYEYNADQQFYDQTTHKVNFRGHGLGDLIDCCGCTSKVTSEGSYELEFTYPRNSALFSELKRGRIVLAKATDYDTNLQPFRIYRISKEINGIVTINGQHISYDLSDFPVKPFSIEKNSSGSGGGSGSTDTGGWHLVNNTSNSNSNENENIVSNASEESVFPVEAIIKGMTSTDNLIEMPGQPMLFSFHTNVETSPITEDESFSTEEPKSLRAILLDGEKSVREAFSCDIVFDGFDVYILTTGGEDRGICLTYGVDIMDLSVEEDDTEFTTAILPYYKSGSGDKAQYIYGDLTGRSGITYLHHKIEAVDVSDFFQSKPTTEMINHAASKYIEIQKIGIPELDVTVSYASLGQDVRMYDAIKVYYPAMDIDITAKVSGYTYDVLNERCTEIEISNATHSFSWHGLEDAGRLKRGILPSDRIKKLGGNKISEASIDTWHLVNGAVTENSIASNAVTGDKIADDSINLSKISSDIQSLFSDLEVLESKVSQILDNGNITAKTISLTDDEGGQIMIPLRTGGVVTTKLISLVQKDDASINYVLGSV